MKVLSCQLPATSSGCPWRSVRPLLLWVTAAFPAALEVSGAFSRASTRFAHLEWLLILCASGLSPPTPISFLFPAQPQSQPLVPPWTLSAAPLGFSSSQLSCPQTCLWRTCFLQGCNDFQLCRCLVTQWLSHCLRGPLALPSAEGAVLSLHPAGQCCCLHQ